MESGVYQIRNITNNEIYIGSAKSLNSRKRTHFSNLKYNRHHSIHLQRAYNLYGKENFIFEILITCDPTMLIWYEQQFLDQWKPEYNISPTAQNTTGIKHSKEYCEAISKRMLGKQYGLGYKHSKETRLKMSLSHTGIKSPEITKAAIIKYWTGNHHTEESKAKISAANKGKTRVFTEEHKHNISIARKLMLEKKKLENKINAFEGIF
jgi:group I intron endonuclease